MVLWAIFAVMTAAGLTALLWPLMRPSAAVAEAGASDIAVYRDQLDEVGRDLARGVLDAAEAESARREISRRLLAADSARTDGADAVKSASVGPRRFAAIAAVVIIPVVGVTFYLLGGSPWLEGRPLAARLAGPVESQSMPELVARVEAHLRENPDDAQGWRVLAPVYMRLGRFDDAAEAFRQVMRVEGPGAQALSNLGEALMQASEGMVTAEARKAFDEAASLDPGLAKPRFYLGIAELQEGDKAAAIARWRKLLADTPADAPWRRAVEAQIAGAGGEVSSGSAPNIDRETMAAAGDMSAEDRSTMIEGMVARLKTRLDEEGGGVDEWLRLARAQTVLGRKEEAGETLKKARAAFEGKTEELARIDSFASGLKQE